MILEKKIVNVASYGRLDSLVKTLDSIIDQCDVVNVVLNSEIHDIPKILLHEKINLVFSDNSYGDAMKFYFLKESDGYYLTIDDDIIYPPNYVDFMISRCKDYNNTRVITLHGRSFNKFPIISYYKSATERYSCFRGLKKNVLVQFGGTGVMCFHTSLFRLPLEYFVYPNMADVWIGKYCMENNLEIFCIRHDDGFVKYIDQKTTIHGNYSGNDRLQTKVVNSIFDKSILFGDLKVDTVENTRQEVLRVNEIKTKIKPTIETKKSTLNYDRINQIFQNSNTKKNNAQNKISSTQLSKNNTTMLNKFNKKR